MDMREFERQTQALREGKLRLSAPEASGMSAYASAAVCEMKAYIASLEAGYRTLSAQVDEYRRRERINAATSGKIVRELREKQWSPSACLGYAAIGMQEAHLPPADTVRVLEAMEEMMSCVNLDEAAEALQAIKEDRPGGGSKWPA